MSLADINDKFKEINTYIKKQKFYIICGDFDSKWFISQWNHF